MGFFSYNCKCCGHPLLSKQATDAVTSWMKEAVVLTKRGSVLQGEYDGYGRVDYGEFDGYGDGAACYHKACWEHAGRPGYDGPSDHADDQGWFFDDGDHDMAPPDVEDPETWLAEKRAERDAWRERQVLERIDDWFDEAHWRLVENDQP